MPCTAAVQVLVCPDVTAFGVHDGVTDVTVGFVGGGPPPRFPELPQPVMAEMVKTAPRQISRDAKIVARRRNCLLRMVVLLFGRY